MSREARRILHIDTEGMTLAHIEVAADALGLDPGQVLHAVLCAGRDCEHVEP